MVAKRFAILAACTFAAAGPALATGTVECEAVGAEAPGARVALTVGSLPVLSVVGMEIVVGDRTWSTGADGDGAIRVGQAFQDGARWLIDVTDANVETVVAELRLNGASEGRDMALAGTLKIPGTGAFAVACFGP